jgi:hypothetical protein
MPRIVGWAVAAVGAVLLWLGLVYAALVLSTLLQGVL